MKPRWFPGWTVVGAVFVMNAVTSGLGFYALSVYLEAITDERGLSTGQVSGATAAFFVVGGLVGVVVGRIIARRDLRIVVVAGALLGAVALVLIGRAEEAWQVYASYLVFAVAFGAAGLLPGTTVVTRWFHRRRSVALSVSSTGLSAGGLLITPIVSRLIDDRGLEDAAPMLATLWAGILLLTLWFLFPDPARRGYAPDGDPTPIGGVVAHGATYDEARASRFFIALTGAYVFLQGSQVGGIAHMFKLVRERVDRPTAALAVSCLAGASVAARLLGGILATRLPLTGFTVVLAALQGSALALLGLVDGRPALLASAILFGVSVGNLLMLHPLLVAEAFGVRDYPRIFSTSSFVVTAGVAGGPVIIGVLHDASDYRLAYLIAAGLAGIGALLLASGGPVGRAMTRPDG